MRHPFGPIFDGCMRLPFAELDAEPAAGVMPLQRARGGNRETGSALQAGSVLHRYRPVGFLGVDMRRAAGDEKLAGATGPGDLLVNLDVALLLVEEEAILRQAFGDRQRFHSSSSPAWTPTTRVPSVSTRSTRTPGMIMTPASSHFSDSHASSLLRNTVTAWPGSASLASL